MMWIWENKKCSGFANLENSLVNFILTLLLRRLFILGMSPYFSLSKIVTNHEINSWENKATLAWLQLRLKSEHFDEILQRGGVLRWKDTQNETNLSMFIKINRWKNVSSTRGHFSFQKCKIVRLAREGGSGEHSVEMREFFCVSDFTWNLFLQIAEV